jgi:hypothetical protein
MALFSKYKYVHACTRCMHPQEELAHPTAKLPTTTSLSWSSDHNDKRTVADQLGLLYS